MKIESPLGTFLIGTRVRKIKGSNWHGHIVGYYSTSLTNVGYCVESEFEPGSVQIYPASALEIIKDYDQIDISNYNKAIIDIVDWIRSGAGPYDEGYGDKIADAIEAGEHLKYQQISL